ncbi:MAG: tRNA (uridine(34)/cytosine(34)/5-carboxymethylaminomethyluridine(34)-2'-O)-methyltransferase TrmL [Alphaproteobacteria bacterium CG_4_10_14_0_2_um_filter_63_37]|nr:MAG: tRNA (uridine(34)/cytosine(34)/5-carboxymethylaminomethyluridine(34)-2'-O)-methyltransferase TrmL [Proteobacteria bacterium CG1_02_64_396]PJA24889.1 MAG: tRNA (uridine(34)/cytosine(34)/5-carboxymethylaminomethyluridine(34)-2'-O)-methyltransferase TrmL [Alphaproteobacteria bacterium CG_4_10_14_0_2_um_filter_63_37]
MPAPCPLHIILYQPEIPPNTGNIVRLCRVTGATLHLIHPLGFSWDDKQLKRAGLDYWREVAIHHHDDWQEFHRAFNGRVLAATTKTERSLFEVRFQPGDGLLFGPESRGLPPEQIEGADSAFRIPMVDDVRSLNLSSAAAVGLYTAWHQLGGV